MVMPMLMFADDWRIMGVVVVPVVVPVRVTVLKGFMDVAMPMALSGVKINANRKKRG
jgi:hypothetical protein